MAVASFDAYQQAAYSFADLVDEIQDHQWDQPALGEWDLRALVGHASRSLITVRTYLARPVEIVRVDGPADYFALLRRSGLAGAAGVADRGRQAGEALGPEPAPAVRALVEDVVTAVYAVPDDPIIDTFVGGMRLSAYLPTRTFELAVHSLDIAQAADVEITLAPDVLAEALRLAGLIAARAGEGEQLLLALTGRRSLELGYSVV